MTKFNEQQLEDVFNGVERTEMQPGCRWWTGVFDVEQDGEIIPTGEEIDVPARSYEEALERVMQVRDAFYPENLAHLRELDFRANIAGEVTIISWKT